MEQFHIESPKVEKIHGYEARVDRIVRLGNLAISSEVIGINDPISHLYQYIRNGEESLVGIKEDIETDIAERLPKNHFVNNVQFDFIGDDFVSVKDKVSMKSMTENNLKIFRFEAVLNNGLSQELERAEIELNEHSKLAEWFTSAQIGSFLVFESLPIGNQKIAISRIYQKFSESGLRGSFVSLHNPSVGIFNRFRNEMVPGSEPSGDVLDILRHQYEFDNPIIRSSADFVDYYVGVYDRLLSENSDKAHHYGIPTDSHGRIQDGLVKVRDNPGLTSVYIDAIRAISNGEGFVNRELLRINNDLGTNLGLIEGQCLSLNLVRDFLGKVINGIVSVIDKADKDLLNQLDGASANYAAISHYGSQAAASGVTYSSNGCPEFGRNLNEAGKGPEISSLEKAFGYAGFDDFGKPKIGVCRVSGCPSHGEYKYIRNRTVVGGCDVCLGCHKLFKQGKSPDKEYAIKKKNIEQQKIEADKNDRIRAEQENEARKLRQRKLLALKIRREMSENKQKNHPDRQNNKRKSANKSSVKPSTLRV